MSATAAAKKKAADKPGSPREKAAMKLVEVLARLEALEDEKREYLSGYRHEKELLLGQARDLREQILTGQGTLFEER